MKNNPVTINFSKNSSSPDSESASSSELRTGSSAQHCRRVPPPAANQTPENIPLATPPSKKPRGRPPGSKNKPKPYYIPFAHPAEPTGKPIIVNVPAGGDVIDHIVDVARRSHASVAILSATGSVASVTIRHTPRGAPALALHGPFTLISLNGSYIYNNEFTLHPGASPPANMSFGINLCSSQGQVFGGAVSGRLIAAADGIQLVLSTFKNPSVFKHFTEGEETDEDNNNNNNNNNSNSTSSPRNFSGGGNLSGYNMVHCEIPGW